METGGTRRRKGKGNHGDEGEADEVEGGGVALRNDGELSRHVDSSKHHYSQELLSP